MSVDLKKKMLVNYFRKHGGMPSGSLHFDSDGSDIGNVYVDDNYYGTFDWLKNEFINIY